MPGRYHLYPFKAGEILHMKKQHPCGSWLWQIERAGADIGLKCMSCGHFIVMPRQKLEKAVKTIQPPPGSGAEKECEQHGKAN
jgi:hypothetical protein